LIVPLDNCKKMFSSLLADGARTFTKHVPGGETRRLLPDMSLRQALAFWKHHALKQDFGRAEWFISVAYGIFCFIK
jgi:hypothetical protein